MKITTSFMHPAIAFNKCINAIIVTCFLIITFAAQAQVTGAEASAAKIQAAKSRELPPAPPGFAPEHILLLFQPRYTQAAFSDGILQMRTAGLSNSLNNGSNPPAAGRSIPGIPGQASSIKASKQNNTPVSFGSASGSQYQQLVLQPKSMQPQSSGYQNIYLSPPPGRQSQPVSGGSNPIGYEQVNNPLSSSQGKILPGNPLGKASVYDVVSPGSSKPATKNIYESSSTAINAAKDNKLPQSNQSPYSNAGLVQRPAYDVVSYPQGSSKMPTPNSEYGKLKLTSSQYESSSTAINAAKDNKLPQGNQSPYSNAGLVQRPAYDVASSALRNKNINPTPNAGNQQLKPTQVPQGYESTTSAIKGQPNYGTLTLKPVTASNNILPSSLPPGTVPERYNNIPSAAPVNGYTRPAPPPPPGAVNNQYTRPPARSAQAIPVFSKPATVQNNIQQLPPKKPATTKKAQPTKAANLAKKGAIKTKTSPK